MKKDVESMSFLYENEKLYFKGGNKKILFEDLPEELLNDIRKLVDQDQAFLAFSESIGINDPIQKLKLFVSYDTSEKLHKLINPN